MKTIMPGLDDAEKIMLKNAGIRPDEISAYSADGLATMLRFPLQRAKSILALIEFQQKPYMGPKFAQNLVDMGYYRIYSFKSNDGAPLRDGHELLISASTDPCIEDQIRRLVHDAGNPGSKMRWWDLTAERKNYPASIGYPLSRPSKAWHALPAYEL